MNEKRLNAVFAEPGADFRGLPFWAWNCELDREKLLRQVHIFKEMGFGGFVIHVREGLTAPYLKEEYMDTVRLCTEEARRIGLNVWLYDEDRWPSGSAGGYVTKNPAYRLKFMRLTGKKEDKPAYAAYAAELGGDGCLKKYCRRDENDADVSLYAYLETAKNENRYNGYTNVDVMNPAAIDAFIEITHNRYKEAVGDEFARTIKAMFTDEPQTAFKRVLSAPDGGEDVILPWTDDFADSYFAQYGSDIADFLPELVWELPGGRVSAARYNYHNHVCDRFMKNFCAKCGAWCGENGLYFTGHFHQEGTLFSQTQTSGDVMRGYVYFDIPGMDLLCDKIEFTTAKQVQSVVRQYGKKRMMSELYGVTNWDFDFRGHKFQGDWQAALGVDVRVPHLAWASMKGSAKRDYPASIGMQSPWYKEYSYVENHFARLACILSRGKAVVKIGVIHPIESFWLHWGNDAQTKKVRERRDREFSDLADWLLFGLLDFDYINEALLADNPGNLDYSVIIVPDCETLRAATAEFLDRYAEGGGRIIVMGDAPKYIDARPAERIAFCERAERIGFSQVELLSALEKYRALEISSDGKMNDEFICSLREDDGCCWLFVARGKKNVKKRRVEIRIKGEYVPRVYDTVTGEIKPADYTACGGQTVISYDLYDSDSLLLRLDAGCGCCERKAPPDVRTAVKMPDRAAYRLEEPNVLLLDMAEYSFMGGEFCAREEVLRIDAACRKRASLPPAGAKLVQPWCETEENKRPAGSVRLRFRFCCDKAISGAQLAFEEADCVTLNSVPVSLVQKGYYVDEAIKRIELPTLAAGENILCADVPFGHCNSIEPMYLLGDFAVDLRGGTAYLRDAPATLEFKSIVGQGFPFYGGNVTYELKIALEKAGTAEIVTPCYRGAFVKVTADGEPAGNIVYAPYRLCADLAAGEHTVELTVYGNRHNTFGSLHNCSGDIYYGPGHWRAEGDSWTYEYMLKDTGLLAPPEIYIKQA